jgi:predicted ABC-class ATPase
MFERSDVWCNETDLNVIVRVIVIQNNSQDEAFMDVDEKKTNDTNSALDQLVLNAATEFLSNCFTSDCSIQIMKHVTCAVVQNRLRQELKQRGHVAFVSDGSILPRKSGASTLPMASPPAIPFEAPEDSPTRQSLTIDMGSLARYLATDSSFLKTNKDGTSVTFTGLVVPAGITLICGGGYHGKV